jgi:hypothetical protein
VVAFIVRLRRGAVPSVDPLPRLDDLPERVIALSEEGRTVKEIVAALRQTGIRTRYRTDVTADAVYAILKRAGLKNAATVRNERVKHLLRAHGPLETANALAARLNASGTTTGGGRPWTPSAVRERLRGLGIAFVRIHARPTRPRPEPSRPLDQRDRDGAR